ncbi:hypothetical protein [Intrasporangium sp.]|uniref:hypothetical protein n=1 Tax=Intrasporangium sp. TaxID=1925024 RepID=UPI00293B2E02|nr:hypothetical protein [Intrasporangium sp.]MDV3222071.1 hypothetical protein [Intrasporangium sp.]
MIGLVAVIGLTTSPAVAAKPPPTPLPEVTVSVSTDNSGLDGAVPAVLARAGDPIELLLTTTVPFYQDVTFTLDVSVADGSPDGILSPNQVTLPAKATSVAASVAYSAVENGVVITPSVGGKGKPIAFTAIPSMAFDSLRTLQFAQQGATTVGTDTCTTTTDETNCGVALLPLSFASARAALSTGATADECAGRPCKAGSTVVQFIAALEGYTAEAPATMIYRCDKSQCGNGGVNKFKVYYSYASSGPLSEAPACLVKNQANPGGEACVDYVNSQRDNAGDLLLYFHFTHDLRGTGY